MNIVKLNLFGGGHTNQVERRAQNGLDGQGQSQTVLLDPFVLCRENLTIVVEAVEGRAKIQNVARDDRGLALREGALNLLGEERQGARKRQLFLRCAFYIAVEAAVSARLLQKGGAARVGVLCVGARVAVEGQGILPVEVNILDAVVGQVVEDDGTHADCLGDVGAALESGVLLLHDLGDLVDGGGKEILQEDDVAGTGRQLGAVDGHRAVGDVNQAGMPVVAHKLYDLEPLLEVQDLLSRGDVDALFKIVLRLAIHSGGDVTGGVEGGAVPLKNKAGRHIIGLEVNNGRAIVDLEQTHVAQLLHLGRHLIGGEGSVGFKHTNETKKKMSELRKKSGIPVVCVETGIVYKNAVDATKAMGGKSFSNIRACLYGDAITAFGYHWKYLGDNDWQPRKNYCNKTVICIETNNVYESIREASRQTGINKCSIAECCRGTQQTAGGFHWKFQTNS